MGGKLFKPSKPCLPRGLCLCRPPVWAPSYPTFLGSPLEPWPDGLALEPSAPRLPFCSTCDSNDFANHLSNVCSLSLTAL